MTWHTNIGDRHLTGAESEFFRAALKKALEVLDTNALDCANTLLEVQSKQSKLHLFAIVGKYLLEPTSDFAPVNAWTEGAVAVMFGCVAHSLDDELEGNLQIGQQAYYWREKILASALERGWKGGEGSASKAEWLEPSDWHEMLEFLEEQIIGDMDWAVDPFGSLASDFYRGQESYYQWCHRATLDTPAVLNLMRELCGYRISEIADDEER